jgi:hypothetical protein
LEVLSNAGIMALACMFVGVLPLTMGLAYAIWPNEQRLTLMRPLSLATIFASVAGVAVGFINSLLFVTRGEIVMSRELVVGIAESLVTLFTGFGFLTVAWLCVTIGLWRRP